MDKTMMEEFERLLMDWESDSLDEAGLNRLRQLMREHPQVRHRYIELQMIDAAIHLNHDGGLAIAGSLEPIAELPITEHPIAELADSDRQAGVMTTPAGPWRGWSTLLLAVAATLLIGLGMGRWLIVETKLKSALRADRGDPSDVAIDSVEATSQGVALLTRLVDVQWSDGRSEAQVGDPLSPGTFSIDSGFAQIEFFCGATVILQGPAELELQSSVSARLVDGRLRAQVPPAARGFQVLLEEMKVVDLGTEFGISVTPEQTDVQVFDGEVELHQPARETRLMMAGNAVVRDSDGDVETGALTPDQFVDLKSLDTQASHLTEGRYQRWKSFTKKLARDPRLIAYYSMDGPTWNRKLRSSIVPHEEDLDGAIVGAKRVAGRWPDDGAVEFKRPGDRVRVDIPGEYQSLTFSSWVKIDSLDRWYNSLFLTDSYERGEPHWQVLDTGQLFFSVRVREGDSGPEHREVLSPPFWKPSLSGRWLHLVTTYDVENRRTTHYLNGEMLSQETIPDFQLVKTTRIGRATIGNWSLPTKPDAEFAIRNLNGSMDEFALFSAALTAEEVQEIYEIGRP